MAILDLVRAHMEVIGSDGQHVGAVLSAENGVLVLASGDPAKPHPALPAATIDRIDTVVRLNAPAREIIEKWLPNRPDAFDSAPITS